MRGQNLRKATKDGVELILQLVKSTTEAIPIPRPQRTKKGNRKIQREPLGEDRSDRHPARRKPTKHTPLTLPVPSQPYPSLRPPHTSPPPHHHTLLITVHSGQPPGAQNEEKSRETKGKALA